MERVLFLCLLFGVSFQETLSLESFIDEPPEQVVAIQGDTILLTCTVSEHVHATLSWQDIDTGNYLTKGPEVDPEHNLPESVRSRISIIGDRSKGEYHLQIQDVVGDIGGRYACYFYDEFSNIATLTVMTPPLKGYPMCTMEPAISLIGVGDNVTLVCESRGGNPPAALTWIRNRNILHNKYTPNDGLPINRYQLVLTEEDTDVQYICLARNPASKQPQSCVLKPLRSNVGTRIEPSSMKAVPGKAAVYHCVTENIPGLVYSWYVNDNLVDLTQRRFVIKRGGKRLKIFPVLANDNFSLIKCVAEQPNVQYDLSGSGTALLFIDHEANPDFIWDTTLSPIPTSPELHRSEPDFTFNDNNIDIADLSPTTIAIPDQDSTSDSLKTTTKGVTSKSLKTTSAPPNILLTRTDRQEEKKSCRGDTCIVDTTESVITTNVPKSSTTPKPPNDTVYLVSLPQEGGQNDVSASSKYRSTLIIGLTLGLILVIFLVLVIVILILWKKRSAKKKEEDKEKQKPIKKATNNIYSPGVSYTKAAPFALQESLKNKH